MYRIRFLGSSMPKQSEYSFRTPFGRLCLFQVSDNARLVTQNAKQWNYTRHVKPRTSKR